MTALRQLGVLDQSPISEGSTGADALANTVDLAQLADRLGYRRYWVAEHHGMPTLASPSPEVLIASIAARTSRITVGSAGVMLPHYSPLKVAETFSMLSGLHPGRIDLGIGRAPGSDPQTALALQRDRRQHAPNDFPDQLAELLAYLEDGFPAGHPLARLAAVMPGRPERPETWLLGSSAQSAIWAAETGLPYAFADFISPGGAELARGYRDAFVPSVRAERPYVAVAVSVICAESDEDADRLAASTRMAFSMLRRGRPIEVPPVERALAYLAGEGAGDPAVAGRRLITGAPATVVRGIEQVAADYGADEVVVVTITHDHAARRRSYELLAEAVRLPGRRAAA
jgi:luciferase family oxidoreductase group 1